MLCPVKQNLLGSMQHADTFFYMVCVMLSQSGLSAKLASGSMLVTVPVRANKLRAVSVLLHRSALQRQHHDPTLLRLQSLTSYCMYLCTCLL